MEGWGLWPSGFHHGTQSGWVWAAAGQSLEAPAALRHLLPTVFVMETDVGPSPEHWAAEPPPRAGPAPRSRQSVEAGPPRGSPLVATCEYDTPGQRDPQTGDAAPGQGPSPKRDPHPGREVDAPPGPTARLCLVLPLSSPRTRAWQSPDGTVGCLSAV